MDIKNKAQFIEYFSKGIKDIDQLKIKCERKFEINPNNMIIGFSSKNCF